MERLIVEVQYGDGYTYSAEDHLPVVFSSKEEFLITLEDTLKQVQEQLKAQNLVIETAQKKYKDALAKGQKTKNMKEKEQKLLQAEITEAMHDSGTAVSARANMKNFVIGGQTFSYENFVSETYEKDEKREYIHLPQVWTIDEYFAEVEFKNSQAQ